MMFYSGAPHCSCFCACNTWKLSAVYKWCFGKIQGTWDDFPPKISSTFDTFPYFLPGCHLGTLARCTSCPWMTPVCSWSFWRPGAREVSENLLSPTRPPKPGRGLEPRSVTMKKRRRFSLSCFARGLFLGVEGRRSNICISPGSFCYASTLIPDDDSRYVSK